MNEIVHGMSMSEYQAAAGVSNSMLGNLKRSPAYALMRQQQPREETDAMRFGTAVHCAVLEPEEFESRYALAPEKPPSERKPGEGAYPRGWTNTNAYKEAVAAMAEHGMEILKPDDMYACLAMRDSVLQHSFWSEVLSESAQTEVSVFADDGPIVRKCRPDMLVPESATIIDLKTCADPRPEPFARSCANLGYHRAAAYYLDTVNMVSDIEYVEYERYLFVCVAKDAPYEVRVYELDQDSLAQGRSEYQDLLAQWMRCARRDMWPAGPGGVEDLRLPEYAINYHLELSEDFSDE